MKITPEVLKKMRACTVFDMPGDVQIRLLDHIDAQAARIAELEKEPAALREQKPVYWQFMSVSGNWIGIGESGKDAAVKEGCEVRPLFSQPVPAAPVTADLRVVSLDALGAACGALQRFAPESKTLALLRRYTFGDLSNSTYPVAPVAVPDFEEQETAFNAGCRALIDCLEDCGDAEQALRLALRAYRAESLRLNSGSKPFVVKLPTITCSVDMVELYQKGEVDGQRKYRERVISAIKAAGGSIADE